MLTGKAVINCKASEKHDGMVLCLDGLANLHNSSKSVGKIDAFYNSVKVPGQGHRYIHILGTLSLKLLITFSQSH